MRAWRTQTLQQRDAASAPMRLVDMGVEPYLVSSTLIGSMAQRLVRKICPKCKTEVPASSVKLPRDFDVSGRESLFRGAGCQHCRNTGFRRSGRAKCEY